MARRFRLRDEGLETLVVELETPGHHIALFHHPPAELRFREPVLLCHGLGANRFNMDFLDDGRGSDRLSLSRTLARAGFDVWVLETRGHGKATIPKRADWTVDDEVAQDVATAIQTVLDVTGSERLYWVGHSWGGILQYMFHARGHPLAARIAGLVTVGSPATLRFQPELRWLLRPGLLLVETLNRPVPLMGLAKLAIPMIWLLQMVPRLFFPKLAPLDNALLRRLFASLAEDISPGIARQALAWVHERRFVGTDGFVFEDHYDRLTAPALFIAGCRDMVAPPDAVRFVAERAGAEDLTFRVMGQAQGCSVDYGHGGLLVGKPAPDEVFPVIERWLASRATPLIRPSRGTTGGEQNGEKNRPRGI